MSKPVISVENLSKVYRIGVKDEIPDTLVGAMTSVIRSPLKNFQRLRRLDTFSGDPNDESSDDTLWALKDVSFEINEGDVVGIIGRNGAGKSTLLKILSRITEPTSGRVVIRGRVSSLLEVGTGFHPELTGRDNIYMNGTILGMTKQEIDRKFDEIVDFSGVEKFLDTPVKRYSSGMQVRLAFAVAAHLEPEILIIDEVLAVGDAEFQKKCLGKMQDVAGQGRTVLFVSHNMPAVRKLTKTGVLLEQGKLAFSGATEEVLSHYVDSAKTAPRNISLANFRRDQHDQPTLFFNRIWLNEERPGFSGIPLLTSGERAKIIFELESLTPKVDMGVTLTLIRNDEQIVTTISSKDAGVSYNFDVGKFLLSCDLSIVPLSPGEYSINCGVNSGPNVLAEDVIVGLPIFKVVLPELESGILEWAHRPWGGVYLGASSWSDASLE